MSEGASSQKKIQKGLAKDGNGGRSKPNDNITDSRPTGFTESRRAGLKSIKNVMPGAQSNMIFSINAIGNLNPKSEESEHFSQYSEEYNINQTP